MIEKMVIVISIALLLWIWIALSVRNRQKIPVVPVVLFVLCILGMFRISSYLYESNNKYQDMIIEYDSLFDVQFNTIQSLENKLYIDKFYCIGTYYNACESQCDETFLLTASNDSIDTVLLNRHQLRWVALSRDLLKKFSYGDTIIIESENFRINGEWIVKDAMNSKWHRRVDFLVPFNDTLNIGKCNIVIYGKN